MIWILLYILIAAAAVFGLSYARLTVMDFDSYDTLIAPVLCGIFWPVASPIYAAYLAAIWYSERSGHND